MSGTELPWSLGPLEGAVDAEAGKEVALVLSTAYTYREGERKETEDSE